MASARYNDEIEEVRPVDRPSVVAVSTTKLDSKYLLIVVFVVYIALVFLGSGISGAAMAHNGGKPISWQMSLFYGVVLIVLLVVFSMLMGIDIFRTIDTLIV